MGGALLDFVAISFTESPLLLLAHENILHAYAYLLVLKIYKTGKLLLLQSVYINMLEHINGL